MLVEELIFNEEFANLVPSDEFVQGPMSLDEILKYDDDLIEKGKTIAESIKKILKKLCDLLKKWPKCIPKPPHLAKIEKICKILFP